MKYLAVALFALLAASFLGRWHGLGDSLAVFRAPIAVLAALAVIWSDWRAVLRWPLVVLCVGVPASVLGAKLATPEPGTVTLYQKNLSFRLDDPAPITADIRAVAPDLVTLQEVPDGDSAVLDALGAEYVARHHCPFAAVGGPAVAARWPMVAGSAQCLGPGVAAMQVRMPQGAVWVVSVHLHWPFPYGQHTQVREILPRLAALDGPVIIGGDFNMVPWGWSVRAIAEATGVASAGPLRPTFEFRGLVPLPIDHALAPGGGALTLRPALGSDHLGVLAALEVF